MSVDPYSNVTIRRVFVTPRMAAAWLKKNLANRNFSHSTMKYYEQELEAGRWLLSPDSIWFDVNDVLGGGQHRLQASVNTDIGFWAFVIRGLPAETRLADGDGLKRRANDTIRLIGGGDVTTTTVAVVNAMRFTTWTGGGRRMGAEEIAEFYNAHEEAIKFTIERAPVGSKGLAKAPALAAIARAYYHVHQDTLSEFLVSYSTGENATAVIRRLRDNLKDGKIVGKKDIYQKMQWAIQAFVDGNDTSRLGTAAEELFPLPEEQEAAAK